MCNKNTYKYNEKANVEIINRAYFILGIYGLFFKRTDENRVNTFEMSVYRKTLMVPLSAPELTNRSYVDKLKYQIMRNIRRFGSIASNTNPMERTIIRAKGTLRE